MDEQYLEASADAHGMMYTRCARLDVRFNGVCNLDRCGRMNGMGLASQTVVENNYVKCIEKTSLYFKH